MLEILAEYLEKWNIQLNDEQEEKFLKYYELLIKRNKEVNLTAITDFKEVQEKHFLDSISLVNAADLNESGKKEDLHLIDVGTGAGFPGIPLKIMFPNLQVILADALLKRVEFLEDVISELELDGIFAVHARAEELGQNPAFREKADICVSRAVAELPILSEYCIPLVKKGGIFVSYKSKTASDEIKTAENAIKVLGGTLEKTVDITMGPSKLQRSLVVIRKTDETPQKYPRKAGKAKKSPL